MPITVINSSKESHPLLGKMRVSMLPFFEQNGRFGMPILYSVSRIFAIVAENCNTFLPLRTKNKDELFRFEKLSRQISFTFSHKFAILALG